MPFVLCVKKFKGAQYIIAALMINWQDDFDVLTQVKLNIIAI